MAYFSLTARDKAEMCETIGIASPSEVFADIPEALRHSEPLGLGEPLTELQARRYLGALAAKNLNYDNAASFLGAGSYDHYIPSVVPALALRGEFATAYTPYQAETSQGTLQVIYEFQTLLCQLTEMEMANASLYDGATALAEAIIMAHAVTRRNKILIPRALSPYYRQVVEAYVQGLPIELVEVPFENGVTPVATVESLLDDKTAAVVLAQPNFFGSIEDAQGLSDAAHAKGALLVSVFNPISVGLLPAPGSYGADIAVAEGQPLGIASSFGGPAVGLFCCKKQFARLAPGRLVGTTTDAKGRAGFTLTLQTREQHIRREKATSNICTNQALCALMATIYLSSLGPRGIREVAQQSYHKAHYAADQLKQSGAKPVFEMPFFHEWVVQLPASPASVNAKLAENGIIGGLDLSRHFPDLGNAMLLCCTEKRTKEEIEKLAAVLAS
jgi:glycine dehydrogenase subunit 1